MIDPAVLPPRITDVPPPGACIGGDRLGPKALFGVGQRGCAGLSHGFYEARRRFLLGLAQRWNLTLLRTAPPVSGYPVARPPARLRNTFEVRIPWRLVPFVFAALLAASAIGSILRHNTGLLTYTLDGSAHVPTGSGRTRHRAGSSCIVGSLSRIRGSRDDQSDRDSEAVGSDLEGLPLLWRRVAKAAA